MRINVKKLVKLNDLPKCFGKCELVCIDKCEVWESCIRRGGFMPLTAKGNKIMASMKKTYGKKKAREIFYASANKGKIKGVHKK
jgi:hypothetical protein